MRGFHSKVELLNANGGHVRYIHAPLAREMVAREIAVADPGNGKVRIVRLVESAATHATRIGEPTPPRLGGTLFTRRVTLDNGARVYEHHPRCTYE